MCCFCMIIQKIFQMKFECLIGFFYYGLQFIISDENVDKLFSAVEYLIIIKLIIAKKVITFGSDIFIFCCDCVFYWFGESINQEFVNHVDEIDDCQIVIYINNLLTMSEPPPIR